MRGDENALRRTDVRSDAAAGAAAGTQAPAVAAAATPVRLCLLRLLLLHAITIPLLIIEPSVVALIGVPIGEKVPHGLQRHRRTRTMLLLLLLLSRSSRPRKGRCVDFGGGGLRSDEVGASARAGRGERRAGGG